MAAFEIYHAHCTTKSKLGYKEEVKDKCDRSHDHQFMKSVKSLIKKPIRPIWQTERSEQQIAESVHRELTLELREIDKSYQERCSKRH